MYVKQLFCMFLCWFFLNQSFADIPVEILRTCIDNKPKNESVKLTVFDEGAMTEK